MKKHWSSSLLLSLSIILAGCDSMNVRDYQAEQPVMDMLTYFSGEVRASGIVQDRSGKVIRRFTLTMHGVLQPDGSLALHEDLVYLGGGRQARDWSVRRVDEHHVAATANGIVGVARGEQYGNALHLVYVLEDDSSGSTWQFAVDDWFFLQPGGVVINRSYGSKWGFHVFDVLTFFQKTPTPG